MQKYIHRPLLYYKRKFDIRTYAMATSINGNFKAYYYNEGYIRTSCRMFTLNNVVDPMIHLTNDAIQKKCDDYGKYEPGNKLSYADFQKYLDLPRYQDLNVNFERDILTQIKKLTTDCFKATWGILDPYKRINSFEVFGFDFMLDEDFKVYLIEVNTNPCLELSCSLLSRIIPQMMDNSFRIAVDPLFPPTANFCKKTANQEVCPENRYELIFDEHIDGPDIAKAGIINDNSREG